MRRVHQGNIRHIQVHRIPYAIAGPDNIYDATQSIIDSQMAYDQSPKLQLHVKQWLTRVISRSALFINL
jgi:hypothetical protein